MVRSAAKAVASAWKVIPGLPARNVKATAKFHTKVLHFTLGGLNIEEGDAELEFASVFVGEKAVVNIYLTECEGAETLAPGWALIAMGTNELDEYYQALLKGGRARVTEGVEDKPWGYRQFTIKDTDNNRLGILSFSRRGESRR